MKKIFTFFLSSLITMAVSAASYGIMINGTDFYAGTPNLSPLDPSFQEYMVLNVQVPAGAILQLYDNDNHAGWAVNLDGASVPGIVRSGDHYTSALGGCFSFYIKLKFGEDQLYIGAGSCQSLIEDENYGLYIVENNQYLPFANGRLQVELEGGKTYAVWVYAGCNTVTWYTGIPAITTNTTGIHTIVLSPNESRLLTVYAPGETITGSLEQQTTTTEQHATKTIQDHQLIILHNGTRYNAMGIRL